MKFFTIVLFVINLINSISCYKKGKETSLVLLSKTNIFNYDNISNLIVFGDSHSAQGQNLNTWELSEVYLQEKKFNWPLQLSNIHNMKLWDFAICGSVVDLRVSYREKYVDLLNQHKKFFDRMSIGKKYYDEWNGNNSLFGIYVGINDILVLNIPEKEMVKGKTEIMIDIFKALYDILETLYKDGARNFLFINLPPNYLAPINRKNKYSFYRQDIPTFNECLKHTVKLFFENHKDTNVILYDNYRNYKYILENYKKFNFVSDTEYWKQNHFEEYDYMEDYFWRDLTHVTYKVHEILSKDIDELLSSLNKNI